MKDRTFTQNEIPKGTERTKTVAFRYSFFRVKLCSDRVKANAKAKHFDDICRLFFDLSVCLFFDPFRFHSRFRLV